jgi:speckle-type POZ protein
MLSAASISAMIFSVKVYSIADKCDVPALKMQAKEKFEKAVKTCWNMDVLPRAVSEIYDSTPETERGLRDPVTEIVCKHIKTLLEKQDFKNVLEETAGFAADITRLMALEAGSGKSQCYKCPNCGESWETAVSPQSINCRLGCGNCLSNWGQYVATDD